MFQFKGILHYIVMTEPESTGYISVDNCKHRLVYDQEWVCSLCGRVFTADEAEEIQRGSAATTTVTTHEDLGLDPHGRTPLWLQGLGTIEGYQNGERDDISILSNIASKLELPSYAALEFLQLYRSFIRSKKDRVYAAKLAILDMLERYPVLAVRFTRMLRYMKGRRVSNREVTQYITAVINMHFGRKTGRKKDEEKDDRDNSNEEYDRDVMKILPWMNSRLSLDYMAKLYGPVTATRMLSTIIKR